MTEALLPPVNLMKCVGVGPQQVTAGCQYEFFFSQYIYIYIDCTSIARDMTIKQVHRTATAEGRGNFPERTILRKFAEAYYKSGHAPKHHGKRNSTGCRRNKTHKTFALEDLRSKFLGNIPPRKLALQ